MYSEQELIQGCKKAKRKYQEALYKQYFSIGISICIRYASNREDALEIINDGFMKVFTHIHSFDEQRSFRAWFNRVMVNTAIDKYRVSKKWDVISELDEEVMDESGSYNSDENLNVQEILGLFSKLPEVYKIIFNLFEIEGYSHEEIGDILKIAPGTSRSHLSRAKKLLRSLYLAQKKEVGFGKL